MDCEGETRLLNGCYGALNIDTYIYAHAHIVLVRLLFTPFSIDNIFHSCIFTEKQVASWRWFLRLIEVAFSP